VRNKGVTSAQKIGTGQYQVIFSQNVTQCAALATLIGIGEVAAFPDIVGVVPGKVSVSTADSAGAAADRSFNVAVVC
jgi:hypothetical protein